MRARFINESWSDEQSRIIDDIFAIWDKWESPRHPWTDRRGIEVGLGANGKFLEFWFADGWDDDFYVDVEEYLKNYKIKYFGEKEPIEWNWGDQSLKINEI